MDKELDVAIIGVEEEFKEVLPHLKREGQFEEGELFYTVGYPKKQVLDVIGRYWGYPSIGSFYISPPKERIETNNAKRWDKLYSGFYGISGSPVFNVNEEIVGMVTYIPAIGLIPAPALGFVPVKRWAYLIDRNVSAINGTSDQADDSYLSQIIEYFGLN